MKIPIEVSARHIHLSQKDLEALFGRGYKLKKIKDLTQPLDFAAEEMVDVVVAERKLPAVRIVGPERDCTQVEISMSDAIQLGINVPLRISGDVGDTPGALLMASNSQVKIKEGLIIAQRHIHLSPQEAKDLGIINGQEVSLKIEGPRSLIFDKVRARVGENYCCCVHLDTDEGNAAGINRRGEGEIIT